MNKTIFTTAISITVLLSSCMDSFLDTESPSKSSSENIFNTTAMTEAALMGVYSDMTDTYMYAQKLSVNWQGVSDVEVGSNVFNTGNYNETNGDAGGMNFYDDPYNNTTNWNTLCSFTERATTVVDGIRKSPAMETADRKAMLGYLGEALVLRALGYFELVRYWGDVPFKENAAKSDLSNVYIGKTDKDTIYNHIIGNLKEAVEYLPWVGEGSYNAERVTKGFALGLLAKVALFAGGWSVRDSNTFPDLNLEHNPHIQEMNGFFVGRPKNYQDYYQIARDACAQLLADPKNPHKLDPDYEDIWKKVNHLELNPYNENLFEVAFGQYQSGDIGALMGYELGSGIINTSRGMGGAGYASTTAYYFYSFDPQDKRRDVACVFQGYKMVDGTPKETLNCNPFGVPCGKWRWTWMTDEYITRFSASTSRISTGINWILMRYPDIYLMFAEAQNELYGPDEIEPKTGLSASAALEIVRERAFGTGSSKVTDYDKSSKEAFFNAITNERAWEFGCESIRKQDLIRWGLITDKVEAMKEALCMMFAYQFPVKIFNKELQRSDMPTRVYYKYETDRTDYIDMNSMNLNEDVGIYIPNESKGEYYCNWIPMKYGLDQNGRIPDTAPKNYAEDICKILVIGTGLNASYDYSELFSRLRWGTEAQAVFAKYPVGNKTCNYRHVFAIDYESIIESQGALSNSYGFRN